MHQQWASPSVAQVRVLESKDQVGGAVKTEYPYAKVPGLGQSTGAYLLGVMPPELIAKLGLSIKTLRRDPHYFLPTSNSGYLLFGSDGAAEKRQFESFFSQADWGAHCSLQEELAAFRQDLGACWLQVQYTNKRVMLLTYICISILSIEGLRGKPLVNVRFLYSLC